MNPVARFKIARINKGQPVSERVAMDYIDNRAYVILKNPDSEYDTWDCCFIKLLLDGKRDDRYPK